MAVNVALGGDARLVGTASTIVKRLSGVRGLGVEAVVSVRV